jgi:D-alanyl-D-alanine carboxypeptidase
MRYVLLAPLASLLLTTLLLTANATAAPADRPDLQRALDNVVAAGALSALVEVRDGATTWQGSSGVAQVNTTTPVEVNGSFRAGSITKTFVATVVVMLAAEERLRLDDTVEHWLPGALPDGDRITIRQLLNHTSGLYDYSRSMPLRDPAAFDAFRVRTWDPRELVAIAAKEPMLFEPGSDFRYGSTDYVLLGLIIEKATGRPYAAEVQSRILRPLAMNDTVFPGTSRDLPEPHAHGYIPDASMQPKDVTEMNVSAGWAAGEVISTAGDLNRFFTTLIDGELVDAPWLADMMTPVFGKDYGLGLRRMVLPCGVSAYGHDGDAPGFSNWSFVTIDGQRSATVSITPFGPGRPQDAVRVLLATALCPAR